MLPTVHHACTTFWLLCLLSMMHQARGEQPITITDQRGITIELAHPIKRVVTIPTPAASMLVAVDGSERRLAAMHPGAKTALLKGVLNKFYPEMVNIPSNVVGESFIPNVEELLASRPDVVLQWANHGEDIITPIENVGLPVIAFNIGTEALTQDWLSIMGKMLGKENKAARLIAWRERVKADLEQQVALIPEEKKPRTLYFLRYLSGLQVAGSGTYNDFYINLSGGKNPAADAPNWRVVNAEQIIVWNPEVILLNGFEENLSPDDVYRNPLLQDVSAVKNRRVYQLPLGGYRWDPPSQESPLTWQWLSMVLHPGKFDWALREQMAKHYLEMYGHYLHTEDVDVILRLSAHHHSAHYEQFSP